MTSISWRVRPRDQVDPAEQGVDMLIVANFPDIIVSRGSLLTLVDLLNEIIECYWTVNPMSEMRWSRYNCGAILAFHALTAKWNQYQKDESVRCDE